MNTTYSQTTKPSHIPVPKHTKSTKNSHLNTKTDLQKPSTFTPPKMQTTVKQPIPPAPRTSTTSTHPQHTRKVPLLPTPPAPVRQVSEMPTFPRPLSHNSPSHHRQFIPRPSPFSTRPPLIYNRFHQQPYTPRPFNHQQIPLIPLPSHQIQAVPGPPQHTPGHLTLQVSYIAVLLPYLPQYYAT